MSHGHGDHSTALAFAAALQPPELKEQIGLDRHGWLRVGPPRRTEHAKCVNLVLEGMLRSAGASTWNLYRAEGALGGLTRPPFTPRDPLAEEHLSSASLPAVSFRVPCHLCPCEYLVWMSCLYRSKG